MDVRHFFKNLPACFPRAAVSEHPLPHRVTSLSLLPKASLRQSVPSLHKATRYADTGLGAAHDLGGGGTLCPALPLGR